MRGEDKVNVNLPAYLTCSFYGLDMSVEKSDVILFGVPFYSTSFGGRSTLSSTYFLRLVSKYAEDNSLISSGYYSKLKISDIGDLISSSEEDISTDIYTIIEYTKKKKKKFLMIGGAHTYTYYTVKYSKPSLLLMLDAHLDLKDKYMGSTFNNATFLRNIIKEKLVEKVIVIGARGFEEEEYIFAKENNVEIITRKDDHLKLMKNKLQTFDSIYVSIDLDHLDPLYMPHVSYPEPLGMKPEDTFNVLKILSEYHKKVIGADIMEYSPNTLDLTPGLLASRIILETAYILRKR